MVVGEWGSRVRIFTLYPIIFTIIIGYYRTIKLIYIDIVYVDNYLAVDYITSQSGRGIVRGVEMVE